MTLRARLLTRIREALGLIRIEHELKFLRQQITDAKTFAVGTNQTVRATQHLVARLHAAQDPNYGKAADDPTVRAESDRIAEEQIRRIEAEEAVRRKYGYAQEEARCDKCNRPATKENVATCGYYHTSNSCPMRPANV